MNKQSFTYPRSAQCIRNYIQGKIQMELGMEVDRDVPQSFMQ